MTAIRTLVLLGALLVTPLPALADSVESTTGAVLDGKIISRDDKFVVIEVQVAGKPQQRKLAMTLVRAITQNGNREVLKGGGAAVGPVKAGATRTKAEVEAMIAEAGKTPPDWLAGTQLNLPKTLDLTWPEKPEGPWNNQKNVGQYVWDVINTNPGKWQEGIKLMEFLLEKNKADKAAHDRICNATAIMYHNLFQDYARAAWWWRQSPTRQDIVGLAECYWKLGNKQMAMELMNNLRQVPIPAIKLWGDMGDPDKAIKLAEMFAKTPGQAEAYAHAGDACRQAGRTPQAISYFQKALDAPDDNRNKKTKERVKASLESIKLFDTLDLKKIADGTYKGSSLGYEAQVEVSVTVKAGRIEEVKVTQHKEKQYYASLTDTPAQIISKQSVKGIDATSRATLTSEAIINASAKALQSGQK